MPKTYFPDRLLNVLFQVWTCWDDRIVDPFVPAQDVLKLSDFARLVLVPGYSFGVGYFLQC